MTAYSQPSNIVGMQNPIISESGLLDKTHAGLTIEQMIVEDSSKSYLETTVQWMEENSIEASQFKKYIPQAIIDKIQNEAIEGRMLRPSVSKQTITNNLDFLL